MKSFLPLLILFSSVFTTVSAQESGLLINESFEGYSNGNLNGQNGWTATGNTNYVQVNNTNALSYPGYPAGSTYVRVVQRDDYRNRGRDGDNRLPDDPVKTFMGNRDLSTNTAVTIFMSFLVNVPSTSQVDDEDLARPVVALRTSNENNLANFYIGNYQTGYGPQRERRLSFGIGKNVNEDGVYSHGNYAANTTYLIVIRYDLRNGTDRMYLWVNPSMDSEPDINDAVASVSGGPDNLNGNINALQLFQEETSATTYLDAFRVSYGKQFSDIATNATAAWEALAPVAAVLPVTFGEIKGYAKDNGVQVDWTVHTEMNVAYYEIERSADGVNFSKTGTVVAQAKEGTLYYNWFDAQPAASSSFYRVKNVDTDGKFSYSAIVRVTTTTSAAAGVTLYPNPVRDSRFSLQTATLAKGQYVVEIFNAAGQPVYSQRISHSGGQAVHSISLPASVNTGVYHLRLSGDGVSMVKKFLVQ